MKAILVIAGGTVVGGAITLWLKRNPNISLRLGTAWHVLRGGTVAAMPLANGKWEVQIIGEGPSHLEVAK